MLFRSPGPVTVIPQGQVDIRGAARITGLPVGTLRNYRKVGGGPKSWLTPAGGVRYWVSDVQAWMASRADHGAEQSARAS